MKSWQLAVLGLAPFLITGCRSDPAIPLLERELYRKDQEINQLRWQVEDLQEMLNSCPQKGAIRGKAAEEHEPEPGRNNQESDGLAPPATDRGVPVPTPPASITNPTRNRPGDDGPVLDKVSERSLHAARATLVSASSAIPFRPSGDSRRVASVAIDPAISGGIGSGDTAGDRGLLVVVQPRDAAGRTVDAPAEIHVTAFDQSLRGEAARIGRWDFAPAETAALFCRTVDGAAIHLGMGWPERPPKNKHLQIFVRYVTADGRRLDAAQSIEIALPGQRTARWTPIEKPPPAERAAAAEPAVKPEPVAVARRADDTPPARNPDPPPPTPYIASRTPDPGPERPVWSPERR